MVEAARRACIRQQEALGCFHGNFCPAIRLREADGGHAMSYTPEAEEILCALLLRDAERSEEGTEMAN